jgi:outer membrane protein
VRARFALGDEAPAAVEVNLYRALGRRGRLGVGAGVIARSSPYRDYDGGVYRAIPALYYNGDRLQVFGPGLRLGLAGSGRLRLAATATYRIGVYEEDESPALQGLGDREDTLLGGFAVQWDLPAGFDLSARYEYDLLDRIGGGEARIRLDKGLQWGVARLAPSLAVNMLTPGLANHDYGVPASKATPDRPAYELDETFSVEAGLGVFIEITRNVRVFASGAAERLSDAATDSPIVEKAYVIKGFGALTYVF